MTALPLTEKELSKDNQSKSELDEFTRDQVRSRPSRSYSHGSEGGSAISRIHSHLSRRQTQPIESDSEDEVDWRPDSVLGSSPVDRSLGLTWKNLTITGAAAGGTINENVSSQFFPPFLRKTKFATMSDKKIIHNSSGCVKPGEMMLVLGRPGAGCTSLLRVLGNRTKGFKGIEGQVMYGSLSSEQATQYRGQIVMDEDESTFFPTLTAQETIDFATRLNMLHDTPDGFRSPEQARRATAEFLFRMLNISHTKDTKVGNEYIRGVSGGERKRVGILEVIAAQGSVYLWDNSTRGLDASTALLYVKSIRKLTDLFGLTTIVTLYQAGNGIYDQFDKILVLENGEQIYYGPRESARPFFEDLGFICADGANVADFLTGTLFDLMFLELFQTNTEQESPCRQNDAFVLATNLNSQKLVQRFARSMKTLSSRRIWMLNWTIRKWRQRKNVRRISPTWFRAINTQAYLRNELLIPSVSGPS